MEGSICIVRPMVLDQSGFTAEANLINGFKALKPKNLPQETFTCTQ